MPSKSFLKEVLRNESAVPKEIVEVWRVQADRTGNSYLRDSLLLGIEVASRPGKTTDETASEVRCQRNRGTAKDVYVSRTMKKGI